MISVSPIQQFPIQFPIILTNEVTKEQIRIETKLFDGVFIGKYTIRRLPINSDGWEVDSNQVFRPLIEAIEQGRSKITVDMEDEIRHIEFGRKRLASNEWTLQCWKSCGGGDIRRIEILSAESIAIDGLDRIDHITIKFD